MKIRWFALFILITLLILLVSQVAAHDKLTWLLEVSPILLGLPILIFTWRTYQFTTLVYGLIILHFIILAVGSVYTYAEVPLGFWMQDWFGFERNNYDKIGHFAQGFVPALIVREILLRTTPLQPGKMLGFIVISICLALSAFYEFIEWWVAVLQGGSAEAFLGTQGYEWDAQADMLMALIGACAGLLLLGHLQLRLLAKRS